MFTVGALRVVAADLRLVLRVGHAEDVGDLFFFTGQGKEKI